MDAAALSEILTRVAVCGAVLLALAAVAVAVWAVVREEWRRGGKVARRVFLVAAAGAATYGGAKNYRASVSYPPTEAGQAYLVDRGSYVTNDFVHIDFARRIVPDDAALVVERREVASTNAADWATYLETTFAAFAVPTNLPCANATNWNWAIWADWTPPPSVQTNGVLYAEWGRTTRDAALRAAGLAVGVPVRSSAWLDGRLVGTPGGTNGMAGVSAASASSLSPETAARAASDALDALTGAAIAIDPIATPEERKTAK